MRSRHPIFAAAMMLIAGIAHPSNNEARSENKRPKSFKALARLNTAVVPNQHYDARTRGWGSGQKHVRFNFPHPPTTAELSKARSMRRKWIKAAVKYPGSPAAIALQSDVASAVARALTQFGSPA